MPVLGCFALPTSVLRTTSGMCAAVLHVGIRNFCALHPFCFSSLGHVRDVACGAACRHREFVRSTLPASVLWATSGTWLAALHVGIGNFCALHPSHFSSLGHVRDVACGAACRYCGFVRSTLPTSTLGGLVDDERDPTFGRGCMCSQPSGPPFRVCLWLLLARVKPMRPESREAAMDRVFT